MTSFGSNPTLALLGWQSRLVMPKSARLLCEGQGRLVITGNNTKSLESREVPA